MEDQFIPISDGERFIDDLRALIADPTPEFEALMAEVDEDVY